MFSSKTIFLLIFYVYMELNQEVLEQGENFTIPFFLGGFIENKFKFCFYI